MKKLDFNNFVLGNVKNKKERKIMYFVGNNFAQSSISRSLLHFERQSFKCQVCKTKNIYYNEGIGISATLPNFKKDLGKDENGNDIIGCTSTADILEWRFDVMQDKDGKQMSPERMTLQYCSKCEIYTKQSVNRELLVLP